jgi:GntR family transcriptional regulator
VPNISRVTPPADVADRLGITGSDAKVVQRVNHYFTDDEPLQIGVTLPANWQT